MIEDLTNNKSRYDELFTESKFSFLQSWAWGEIKKPEWAPIRLSINNIPLQILSRKLPVLLKSFGYIPRGFNSEIITQSPETLTELKEYLLEKKQLTHLIVEPNSSDSQVAKIFKQHGFSSGGITIQPNYTNIINLTSGLDKVLSEMKPQFRRDARKSNESGIKVEIFEQGEEGLSRFYKIMENIFNRTKFIMHGSEYFSRVWKELSESKYARIYIASNGFQDLGSILVALDDVGSYELYGGLSEEGKKFRVGPYLRIEAIKDIIELDKKYYDQWGVAKFDINGTYDLNHELYGISIFKKEMGGENVKFLSQQVVVRDWGAYLLYKVLIWLNGLKVKLKKL